MKYIIVKFIFLNLKLNVEFLTDLFESEFSTYFFKNCLTDEINLLLIQS